MRVSKNINTLELADVIERARTVAVDYYRLTGRPLGITGEIGEYDAARILGMELAGVRMAGYDAVKADGTKVQIKTRYLREEEENQRRVPAIKMTHSWDTAMLVLLDENFNARAIYEAPRLIIEAEILKSGDKTRMRGAIGLKAFKTIAQRIWPHTAKNIKP